MGAVEAVEGVGLTEKPVKVACQLSGLVDSENLGQHDDLGSS